TEPRMNRNRSSGSFRSPAGSIQLHTLAVPMTVIFGVILLSLDPPPPTFPAQAILAPVPSISYQFHNHIHGLGYDSKSQRLFVATHYGIFIWTEGKLFQLGENRDDFMGFSLHPSDPNIVYTSGHPRSGGNMGVMKSEDGGVTFKRIFQGLQGETVDFHSMTISSANPKIVYGWFQERLYRSKDEGKSWQVALGRGLSKQGFCFGAPCLSPDSKNEGTVYAGTSGGLLVSHDFGESWMTVNANLGAVAGIGVEPSNSRRLFAFTQKLGLASSRDGGKSWQAKNSGVRLSQQEFVFAFAFDRKNSKHLFAATPEQIFRSADGGENWEKIL
ncbi:MAG: WD40/YVTN/BNR-like repeat-containing protein, partial [Candidatus Binatia bacterium]